MSLQRVQIASLLHSASQKFFREIFFIGDNQKGAEKVLVWLLVGLLVENHFIGCLGIFGILILCRPDVLSNAVGSSFRDCIYEARQENLLSSGRAALDSPILHFLSVALSLVETWFELWNYQKHRYRALFSQWQLAGLMAFSFLLVWGWETFICMIFLFSLGLRVPSGKTLHCFCDLLFRISEVVTLLSGIWSTSSDNEHYIDALNWKWQGKVMLRWHTCICENQRWWAGLGWSCNGFLRQDPGPWSNIDGIEQRQACEMYLILEKYQNSWEEGPSFAALFTAENSKNKGLATTNVAAAVRRRRWTKTFEIPLQEISLEELCLVLRSSSIRFQILL